MSNADDQADDLRPDEDEVRAVLSRVVLTPQSAEADAVSRACIVSMLTVRNLSRMQGVTPKDLRAFLEDWTGSALKVCERIDHRIYETTVA